MDSYYQVSDLGALGCLAAHDSGQGWGAEVRPGWVRWHFELLHIRNTICSMFFQSPNCPLWRIDESQPIISVFLGMSPCLCRMSHLRRLECAPGMCTIVIDQEGAASRPDAMKEWRRAIQSELNCKRGGCWLIITRLTNQKWSLYVQLPAPDNPWMNGTRVEQISQIGTAVSINNCGGNCKYRCPDGVISYGGAIFMINRLMTLLSLSSRRRIALNWVGRSNRYLHFVSKTEIACDEFVSGAPL